MQVPPEFLGPFIGSNVVAVLLVLVAWWRPTWARWTFSVVFLAAGVFNALTVRGEPEAYTSYAQWALLDAYRNFIQGSFSEHTAAFVTVIAAGQLLVGALLALPRPWRDAGLAGAIVFLLAIAPLGAGSAFPATVVMALAVVLIAWSAPTGRERGRPSPT
ncbi:MAG: hypothetical protein P8Y02_09205 [Deinococcales bacterium]